MAGRGVPLEAPVFDVGPGGRVVLDQVGVAGQLGFGHCSWARYCRDGGLGLPEVVLVRVLLDDEERLALLDLLPVLEEDLLEIPHHPGDQLDGVDGLGVPGEIQTVGHRLLHGLGDRHLRGRWRLWLRLLLAAGLQDQEPTDQAATSEAAGGIIRFHLPPGHVTNPEAGAGLGLTGGRQVVGRGGQQAAPVRALSHLRLDLGRHDVLALPDLPAAPQRPVHPDEARRDVAERAGQAVLLAQERLLSGQDGGEVGHAFPVLQDGQVRPRPAGRDALGQEIGPVLRAEERGQVVLHVLLGRRAPPADRRGAAAGSARPARGRCS